MTTHIGYSCKMKLSTRPTHLTKGQIRAMLQSDRIPYGGVKPDKGAKNKYAGKQCDC